MSDLPKVSIFTLGCKVNQYDTDAMLAVFEHAGFEITEGLEFADVYIVNSCAVTAEAEKNLANRLHAYSKSIQTHAYTCADARLKTIFLNLPKTT